MKQYKKWILSVGLIFVGAVLVACGAGAGENETVRIGVVGEDNEVWDFVIDKLEDEGISAKLVKFTDYAQPNNALAEGEIELNSFQHKLFLKSFNKDNGTDLVPIADTYIAPLGIYSDKITSVDEIEENDTIAIPNDVTNGGRALLLLQTAGLIEVDSDAGVTPTVNDITNNSLNLEIKELDASQTARALQDVKASIINSGMAVDYGFVPTEDSIFLEPVNDDSDPYVNIIVARAEDADNEVYQKIIDAFQAEDTIEVIKETSKGSSIPVWNQ